ncbi:unnamed protein product [Rotaria sordida]|uniref:dihydropyrimidinase n=1 Tax=Rotaria sordida TaxID=392033 RepID=A0A814DPF6_9BILA|nr:unnamed protein product [Rotaria sordida]
MQSIKIIIPNGVNGVEDRLAVIWTKGVETGKLDVNQFVAVTSSNAARIFNIYPKKGRIAVGSDGDCIIWDPAATKTISASTHHQACDFNIFEGFHCHGLPIVTIVAGKIAYENGQLSAIQGSGKYLETPCFAEYVYQKLYKREQLREQQMKQQKIEREPYTGEVIDINKATSEADSKAKPKGQINTSSGGRNLLDSSFTLSGNQWDDGNQRKTTRVHQPPGGQSKGLW